MRRAHFYFFHFSTASAPTTVSAEAKIGDYVCSHASELLGNCSEACSLYFFVVLLCYLQIRDTPRFSLSRTDTVSNVRVDEI